MEIPTKNREIPKSFNLQKKTNFKSKLLNFKKYLYYEDKKSSSLIC